MKKRYFNYLFFSFAFALLQPCLVGSAIADESEEKEFSKAEHLFPLAEELTGSKIEQLRDEYLNKRGWGIGFDSRNPGGAYIGWGTANINIDGNDLKFGQARIMAFNQAMISAVGQFAVDSKRTTITKTASRLFQDDNDFNSEEFEVQDTRDRLEKIVEKSLKLTDAKLDSELIEYGVDPDEFKAAPLTQRRKMLEDSISREIFVQSIKSTSGIRPLATWEDTGQIGVLVVSSDKLRKVAQGMASGRVVASLKNPPSKTVKQQIEEMTPSGAKDFVDTHGIRVMTDENGNRAVVGFGQWSPAITRNDSKFRRNASIKAARAIARNNADGFISDFVKSTVVANDRQKLESSAEINQLITGEEIEEVESTQVGTMLDKLIKQTGSSKLEGVSTVTTWTANHPVTGHLIVGHVLMWSPSTRDAAKGKFPKPRQIVKGKNAKLGKDTIRQSPEFEDDADF